MNSTITTESELRQAFANLFTDLARALSPSMPEVTQEASKAPVLFLPQSGARLNTEWPKLGVIPREQTLAELAAIRDGFGPGSDIFLYSAGSTGLAGLARQLQLPLFKIGITQQTDLLIRRNELRSDCYGGQLRKGNSYLQTEGFDDWDLRQMDGAIDFNPIVAAAPRALRISLPRSLTFKQFEKLLDGVLTPISLSSWIKTSVGRQHLAQLPIDPAIADRFTAYRFGSSTRHSRATELYVCRPRDDIPNIAAHIVRIIHHHLTSKSEPAALAS